MLPSLDTSSTRICCSVRMASAEASIYLKRSAGVVYPSAPGDEAPTLVGKSLHPHQVTTSSQVTNVIHPAEVEPERELMCEILADCGTAAGGLARASWREPNSLSSIAGG